MKHILSLTLVLIATTTAAQAACFADYKAKQDNPLRLHYGVAEIDEPCTVDSAKDQIGPKLQADGWVLLNIVGTFGDAGLDSRKDSAGEYFLRY
ncbi:hypothetical protein SAMN05428995_101406 [Loktanella sp. DSM 29012]|uniref:Uncharacterized protein n=1 Tax=Loktanella gaetbuli TaxID=2881335 RepID=A0ABS8BTM0_9RHOB|nr:MULTISPECIES: hypothetical protein [Loktanella]MCB5199067.1 hypothetical protein [Loktanella gaetbuli]SEP65252.1 hypothetical protein SAMN05428995_101406 [Loktanella sp. DSM 29012]